MLALDGDQQHRDLCEHPEVGADPEHQQLGVAHPDGIDGQLTGDQRYTSSVVIATRLLITGAHAGGPKLVAGVEDCHEHRGQAVGQHLGEKQVGEGRRKRLVDLRVAAQHQPHQQRRGQYRQRGGDQQQHGHQRDQAPHECRAAVGVGLLGAGQHRHEDRGERRLQHERGDQGGQLIGHRERAGQCGAQDGGQQHDFGEPGQPADQGREPHRPRPRHQRGVGQFGPLTGQVRHRGSRRRGRIAVSGLSRSRGALRRCWWLSPVARGAHTRFFSSTTRRSTARCVGRRAGRGGPGRRDRAGRGSGAKAAVRPAAPARRLRSS